MTPFHSLPIQHKPRERLQRQGAADLSLEELIAILLRTGTPGQDIMELSSRVAAKLLSNEQGVAELATLPGVGVVKATEIVAALHLPAALRHRRVQPCLSDPQKVYAASQDLLEESQEHLVVFFINVRNQQIARETVSIGTATASLVHPREVFRPAILHNASHIVLAHNHPSGNPSPSRADQEATRQIAQAGLHIGIELVDHVVCAREGYVSLKEDFPGLFF